MLGRECRARKGVKKSLPKTVLQADKKKKGNSRGGFIRSLNKGLMRPREGVRKFTALQAVGIISSRIPRQRVI